MITKIFRGIYSDKFTDKLNEELAEGWKLIPNSLCIGNVTINVIDYTGKWKIRKRKKNSSW